MNCCVENFCLRKNYDRTKDLRIQTKIIPADLIITKVSLVAFQYNTLNLEKFQGYLTLQQKIFIAFEQIKKATQKQTEKKNKLQKLYRHGKAAYGPIKLLQKASGLSNKKVAFFLHSKDSYTKYRHATRQSSKDL